MKKRVLYGIIAMATMLSLAGCGSKEKAEETPVNETAVQTEQTVAATVEGTGEESMEELVEKIPEESVSEIQEQINSIEVTSDDNKIEFKQADNITGIYYHDGEKITGMETRINYESPELALAAKAEAEAVKAEVAKIEAENKLKEDLKNDASPAAAPTSDSADKPENEKGS